MAKKEKLARGCKELMVKDILLRFKKQPNFVLTSYMGSSVSELELLRRELKKSSSSYFVVKNAILKQVFMGLDLKDEIVQIDGGMGISLCAEDVASTCKVLFAFAKGHEKFKVKVAIVDGKTISTERVKVLADLPPRIVLLARVVGTINAPISGFVCTLSGVLRKFVYAVDAIKKSKEAAGPSGA